MVGFAVGFRFAGFLMVGLSDCLIWLLTRFALFIVVCLVGSLVGC